MRKVSSLLLMVVLGSCAGADEVDGAIGTIGAPGTHLRLAKAGNGYGGRAQRMRELVPEVETLLAAGAAGAPKLIARFGGTPAFAEDAELVVLAWVLGELRHRAALEPLARFLERNLTGDLWLAPQAAAHTIFLVSGDGALNTKTYHYDIPALRKAIAVGSAAMPLLGAAIETRSGWQRRLLVSGGSKTATIEGKEFANTAVSEGLRNQYRTDVLAGGGTFATEFGDGPARCWNCAGFAFRELNGGNCFNTSAPDARDRLVEAGVLMPVSTPQAGDKVFFRQGTGIAHVGIVESVTGGIITVINADNQSGVFRIPIDGGYFQERSFVPEYYRWTTTPKALDDPATATDSAYCNGPPPVVEAADGPRDGGADAPADAPSDAPSDKTADMGCPMSQAMNGFCAGQNDCPPNPKGGYDPPCAPKDGGPSCPAGFCFTRSTIACEQIGCPAMAGRTYTEECCCDCWADQTYMNVYDPCRPGYLLMCAPRKAP